MRATLAVNDLRYCNESSRDICNTIITQLTLTCSKSTIETLEKGVKYFRS